MHQRQRRFHGGGGRDGRAHLATDGGATEEPTEEPTAEPTEEPTPEPTEEPAPPAPPTKVIVQSVSLAGDDGTVVLRNLAGVAITMEGWFICQRPIYWAIPSTTLQPGAEVTLHAGAGTNDASNFFASGGFGSLAGGQGEIALYDSANFGSSESIVSFVAWNGGSGRALGGAGRRDLGIGHGPGYRRRHDRFCWPRGGRERVHAAVVAPAETGARSPRS